MLIEVVSTKPAIVPALFTSWCWTRRCEGGGGGRGALLPWPPCPLCKFPLIHRRHNLCASFGGKNTYSISIMIDTRIMYALSARLTRLARGDKWRAGRGACASQVGCTVVVPNAEEKAAPLAAASLLSNSFVHTSSPDGRQASAPQPAVLQGSSNSRLQGSQAHP